MRLNPAFKYFAAARPVYAAQDRKLVMACSGPGRPGQPDLPGHCYPLLRSGNQLPLNNPAQDRDAGPLPVDPIVRYANSD